MFARVHRLRRLGVLLRGPKPAEEQWARGIFETTTSHVGMPPVARRSLVLRDAMAAPDRGVIYEMYQPVLVEARSDWLRLRGVEAVSTGPNEVAGMVQEWLVRFIT